MYGTERPEAIEHKLAILSDQLVAAGVDWRQKVSPQSRLFSADGHKGALLEALIDFFEWGLVKLDRKPCPFCGSRELMKGEFIACDECLAALHSCDIDDGLSHRHGETLTALAWWNRRSASAAPNCPCCGSDKAELDETEGYDYDADDKPISIFKITCPECNLWGPSNVGPEGSKEHVRKAWDGWNTRVDAPAQEPSDHVATPA